MGTTIHYGFRAWGDGARVRSLLDLIRTELIKLPVQHVGEIMLIPQVRFTGGTTEIDKLAFSLGLHMKFHFNLFELPDEERQVVERRILDDGNGLGLSVDVAEGCERFQIVLGRVGDYPIWSGHGFTKTTWAEDWEHAHNLVIEMLELCDDADILDCVTDEAGIWQESLSASPTD